MMYFRHLALGAAFLCAPLTLDAGSGSIDPATGEADISIHFSYPPTSQEIADIRDSLQTFAVGVCDSTDGQIRLDRIRLTGAPVDLDRAEFVIHALPGRSGGGVGFNGNLGTSGSRLNMFRTAVYRPDIWLHEWGHQAYGLGEQYSEQRRFGSSCGIGPGFDPGSVDEQNHSIMQQSGRTLCEGGANANMGCYRNADCPGSTCEFRTMSEMSTATNHDLLQGTGTCPMGAAISSIALQGDLSTLSFVQVFDDTSFATADATSAWQQSIEAIDSIGNLPAAELRLYITRTNTFEWELRATIDEGFLGGTSGSMVVLETWTLRFNVDGSLLDVSEAAPAFTVSGLATGAADMNISLDLGTPNPSGQPGQGLDGLVQGVGITNVSETHDGQPRCNDPFFDCPNNFNATTGRFEATMQTLWKGGASDWDHVNAVFPFVTPPAIRPVAAAPAVCQTPVTFVEDITGSDQVLLVMDRSSSMGWSSSPDEAEVCLNGTDDDNDGIVDEAACANPRMEFAQGAARAFIDLQVNRGVEVGLMQFDHSNNMVRGFAVLDSGNRSDYLNDVDGLMPRGQTAIGDAFLAARPEFAAIRSAGRSQTAYLLTDGFNTAGSSPEAGADSLKEDDVRIHTIGAGRNVNTDQLIDLADRTGGDMYHVENVSELTGVFAEMAAKQTGAAMALPRVNFVLARNPKEALETDPDVLRREGKVTPARGFRIEVERGAKRLTAFISGRNIRMQEWGVDMQLISPSGQMFDRNSPEIRIDSHYLFLDIQSPEPGTWQLQVTPARPGLQFGTALAFIDNPLPTFHVDVVPARVRAGDSAQASANLSYLVEVDTTTVGVEGQLTGPDGSTRFVTLARDPFGGLMTADLTSLNVNGIWELTLTGRTLSNPLPMRGEPIFEGPERPPVKVEPFLRYASTRFEVFDGEDVPCIGPDCDGDGIDDKRECPGLPIDLDKDGIPNDRDEDSDNDEIPDAVEGGMDRNRNGVDDACEPGPERRTELPGLDDFEIIIERQKRILDAACRVDLNPEAADELYAMVEEIARIISAVAEKDEVREQAEKLFREVAERKRAFARIAAQGLAECRIAEDLLVPALDIEAEIFDLLQR